MALTINLGLTADATGTVDAITATYSPAPTLVDKKILFLVCAGANTVTNPTFNPNSLGVRTIYKKGGQALSAGDLGTAAGFVAILEYNLANTRWELLNPATSAGGGGETLAQTLALGNSTGANDIVVTDGQNIKSSTASGANINFNGDDVLITSDGGGEAEARVGVYQASLSMGYNGEDLIVRATDTTIEHSVIIKLDTPDVQLVQETASLILSTNASKNIKGLSTATYPSLTELSYVKGLTSALQTQLNAKGYNICWESGNQVINPGDATTYYVGAVPLSTPSTTADRRRFYFVKDGTIKLASIEFAVISGTLSTAETSSAWIRINNTTDYLISSSITNDAINTRFYNSSLSVSVTTSDYFEIKWTTPTWVTNPTQVGWSGTIFING